jgi:DNA-binding Lrp family transcriptional regulator
MSVENERLLDNTGWRILEELQGNARLTHKELGRRVNLSAPAAAERVRRMEEAGIITGYRAQVDPEKVGLPLAAFEDRGAGREPQEGRGSGSRVARGARVPPRHRHRLLRDEGRPGVNGPPADAARQACAVGQPGDLYRDLLAGARARDPAWVQPELLLPDKAVRILDQVHLAEQPLVVERQMVTAFEVDQDPGVGRLFESIFVVPQAAGHP